MARIPLLTTLLLLLLTPPARGATPDSPEAFLGHPVGADNRLATWPQVVDYLRQVSAASDRVSIENVGQSTLGNEMLVVVLTSESNQGHLDHYREIARQLANPDELTPEAATQLVADGKTIVLVTCTIHSTEVGSTQMAMEFVYDFATTHDASKRRWMEDVIVLLMPSINPDGQIMIADWYEKYLGTEFEGGQMPWLYHHYVGHDNNRDFFMLTQRETQAVNDVLYHEWFPQIFLDEHQMGSTGPRMFVPPQADPLDPEIDSLIFRQADLIGTNMSFRLEEAGRSGVGHNMIFDSYWPGGTRNTAWWKNVTGLLTEVASARIASPIYVDAGELTGEYKGLPEYSRRSNFPSPWPGGWWRLRDIIDYELIATWALVETASQYRQEFLTNFHRMGQEAIRAGMQSSPSGWLIPPDQHDAVASRSLIELLLRHGVRVFVAQSELRSGYAAYPANTYVIPAAQPYRTFLLTMLRPQRYPEVIPYQGGPVLPPYDITSWSLPISMGVEVIELTGSWRGDIRRVEAPLSDDIQLPAMPQGYFLPHSADSIYRFINRLAARDKNIYSLPGSSPAGSDRQIFIPASEIDHDEIVALAGELHLPVRATEGAVSGPAMRIGKTRVGLYKPWVASMDEGWTRWLLEQYEFDYLSLNNEDIKESSFVDQIDVLLLPDVDPSIISMGEPDPEESRRWWSPLPPEYAGGLGLEGGEALAAWIRDGGTVVALDSSSAYLIDLLNLPVENVLAGLDSQAFRAPGTMLRIELQGESPLTFGLREREAVYFSGSAAFRTRVPDARFARQVVARYPEHRDDILVSGYLQGAEILERRAAVVEIGLGKGRVVLFGFRPQHRAQTVRTFKMLFNALLLPGLTEEEL